jgi:nucleoside-diphosphate-sugar epimerase
MLSIVTGVAGFIGSSLAETLLERGDRVIGIDCFLDYYPREIKERNLQRLHANDRFRFLEQNLAEADLASLLQGADVVYHQAAQAGVRASWGTDFSIYTQNNILATQRLLEALKGTRIKLINASSSSVYGEVTTLPMRETDIPRPISPYGVSKLAAEHLCCLYAKNYGVETVSLRYFTVYGPRQRPDMAFHRFIKAMLRGQEMEIYGNGEQTRDFTYIQDAVSANLLAAERGRRGEVYNIGGGTRATLNQVLALLERLTGKPARTRYREPQKGDVIHTYADTQKAQQELLFHPTTTLEHGLMHQIGWMQQEILPFQF